MASRFKRRKFPPVIWTLDLPIIAMLAAVAAFAVWILSGGLQRTFL